MGVVSSNSVFLCLKRTQRRLLSQAESLVSRDDRTERAPQVVRSRTLACAIASVIASALLFASSSIAHEPPAEPNELAVDNKGSVDLADATEQIGTAGSESRSDRLAESAETGSVLDPNSPNVSAESWRTDQRLCGLNAVYVLLKMHECKVSYNELQSELPIAEDGITLRQMHDALRKRGLPARVVRGGFDQLSQVPLPAVAHLVVDRPTQFFARGRGHFVTVVSVNLQGVQCVDGTTGRLRTMPPAEFFREWSGYLLIVEPRGERAAHLVILVFCLCVAVGSWLVYANTGRRTVRNHSRPPSKSERYISSRETALEHPYNP